MTIRTAPARCVAFLTAAVAGLLGLGLQTPVDMPLLAGLRSASAQQAPPEAGNHPIGAGLCVGCHSPEAGVALSGKLTGNWLSPNITPDPVSGIGAWSRRDLFRYFRDGRAPGRGQAGGPMAPVIEALQSSSDAELNALIDWLFQQPPVRNTAEQVAASEKGQRLGFDAGVLGEAAIDQGAILYNNSCASCHGIDGAGSRGGQFPSMFHNSSVGRREPYNLVAALLGGVERHMRDGVVLMQSFDETRRVPGSLSDADLATLSNFVLKQFGDSAAAALSENDIARSRLRWWGEGEPSAARGQLIAFGGGPSGTGATCFGCHGLRGQGDAGSGSPRLARLDVSYFAKQMRDYASGTRPHLAMSAIARELTDLDNHSLALYYAGLPPAKAIEVSLPDQTLIGQGEALYTRGCSTCHGAAGQGFNPVHPAVVQPASYTAGQLRLWRQGIRRNDPHDLMGVVSRRLTDADIQAVSAYLASLEP